MKEQVPSEELESLRGKWADQACLLDSLYGKDKPEANALRNCIRDLHDLIHADEPEQF